jgi:hypothetical protein
MYFNFSFLEKILLQYKNNNLSIIIIIILLLCTLISRLLMLTLIFLGIIVNFLPLYRLSYFVFCSFNYFCVFLCTRASFVIGLCAVKFARK